MSIDNKLNREHIEKEVAEQTNIDYLVGLRRGIKERDDIGFDEKQHYNNLINYKIVKVKIEKEDFIRNLY